MANQDNIVSFENMARERAETLSAKLVQDTRSVLMNTLPKLIQSLYEKLDDGLFEQALFEKSGKNDSLDNLFFDTMRQLRKQREGFIRIYVSTVIKNFDEFWNLQTPQEDEADSIFAELDHDSLSLVDEGVLEEDLALDGVVAKGMRQFSKEVFALNQRFAAMKQIDEVTDEQNPVGPGMVSKAFPVSIKTLDVDLRIKLVIYKLFEKEVIQYLGAMYDEINELLKNAGVLPKLPSRVKKNPVSPAIIRQQEIAVTPEEAALSPQETNTETVAVDAAMFNTLRGLLQNNRGVQSPETLNLPKVEANELVGALSGMQTSADTTEMTLEQAAASIAELRSKLGSSLQMGEAETAVRAFNGMDEDTIDVISMLFEFILDDTNLPDTMKALLSRLQIPMLKVAILDRQFFSDKQHSARRLLNLLAKSAVGWADDGDRSANSFYAKISSVVTRILEEFREDLSMFDELYEEFYKFINQEEQGAELIEERVTEVTRGKEKMKLAQIRVAEVINTRVKGLRGLPTVVKELLKDGWKDVLTLTFLRQGEESEKWLHVVGLVDKLLWSVQPKQEVAQRQKLLKSIPELLKALRAELVEISFDQHKLGVLFKQLQTCHIHALKGASEPANPSSANQQAGKSDADVNTSVPESKVDTDAAPSAPAVPVTPQIEDNIIEAPQTVAEARANSKERDEFDDMADKLEMGSWVEWSAEEDRRVRGKLTWKSPVTGTMVFVGRKGTKVAEMMLDELAELFRLEKARRLDDTQQPLMERAMTAMVDTLQKKDSATPASSG